MPLPVLWTQLQLLACVPLGCAASPPPRPHAAPRSCRMMRQCKLARRLLQLPSSSRDCCPHSSPFPASLYLGPRMLRARAGCERCKRLPTRHTASPTTHVQLPSAALEEGLAVLLCSRLCVRKQPIGAATPACLTSHSGTSCPLKQCATECPSLMQAEPCRQRASARTVS